MRIGGYGSGLGQGGGGRQRADIFRARHHVGERLRGRILGPEPGGLTLVEVDGQELMARLEVPAEPGTTLFFIVRALLPEIHLQALQGQGPGSDPASLIQLFRTAREQFEQRAGPALEALPLCMPPNFTPPAPFQALLAANPELAAAYEQTLMLLGSLNAHLAHPAGREALYAPWLFPGLRRMEALVKRPPQGTATSAMTEIAASGETARHGEFELRLSSRPPRHNLRLYLQHPQHAPEVSTLAREALGADEREFTLGRMAAPCPGGVFSELMGDAPTRLSSGLNTRV